MSPRQGDATGPRRVDQSMARGASWILEGLNVDPELRTRFRQLPVMVRTSGLAAAYAFLVAKGDHESNIGLAYERAATGIREHLDRRHIVRVPAGGSASGAADLNRRLITELASMTLTDYLRASTEVELLAGWLSRLADAKARADRHGSPTGGGRDDRRS